MYGRGFDNETIHPSIILFDGICNLCNAFIDFIIRRDVDGFFYFASLQSDFGQNKIMHCHGMSTGVDSVILIEGEKCYSRSTAALRIIRKLSFPWPLGYIFIILPNKWRDAVYDSVAKNRYRWFGKRDTCRLPTPEERDRFIG